MAKITTLMLNRNGGASWLCPSLLHIDFAVFVIFVITYEWNCFFKLYFLVGYCWHKEIILIFVGQI